MRTQTIDRIVNEILTDMSNREKDATVQNAVSSVPNVEDAFGELIQKDDEASRVVMRRIWKKLQETHRTRMERIGRADSYSILPKYGWTKTFIHTLAPRISGAIWLDPKYEQDQPDHYRTPGIMPHARLEPQQ